MGPPPPPPPPPPQSVLAPRGRTSANPPRRDNNPISSSSAPARQSLDAAALQHAAASLRKTVDGQQIRSDSTGLSNGSLAGSNQQLPGRDRSTGEDQRPLGGYQSIQQVYATPSRSVHSGAHSDLRGRANPINDYNQQPPLQSSYPSYNAPIVTIQPPSEAPVYSNSNRTTDFHQTTYSIPRPYSSSQYITSSPSSTQHYQSSNYTQPVSSRNVTVTKTYTYETPHQPAQATTFKYHSESTQGNNNYINTYKNTSGDRAVPTPTPNGNYSTPRSTSPYIHDARQRIHDFATATPADVSHQTKETTSEYSLIRKSPSLQQRAPQPGTDFAKQLRDQGLTERQKFANRCQKTTVRDTQLPFSPEHIYQNSFRNDEVDHLVQKMSNTMHSGYSRGSYNICSVCNEEITNDKPGCTAMDRIYHIACFICKRCGSTLAGSSFYNIEGEALCEKDYNDSLERCNKCGQAIADRLLRACGGAFHTQCFTCSVCNVALDGVPFTVDKENQVHCVPCYHQRYAPRCAVCTTPIIPRDGEKESVRVVAMDKSFHPECYRCEDCGLQLSSKVEGAGCYPIDQHLLCRTCNSNRLRLISSA